MFKLHNFASTDRKNSASFYMALIISAYVLVYSLFLHLSNYLPYVFDNNETYSSLVHAYNMYFGDWGTHFGLADEAYSPDPAAHPMIHTHQGNWPRIFSYVLFVLGARSAESQIAIHVFTIGLIAIYLMFRFFSKAANCRFATIACLIFMTDYILFAQWQVVTYRVWHVFFVFASLRCMQEIDGGRRIWKTFFILNFAALYYWELVFAFYISVWSLLYYAYLVSWNAKKSFKCGCLIAASGIISLVILFIQLCMFMGFENVIKDYYYTFFARNAISNGIELKQRIQDFYNNMDVIFWYNIVDTSKLRQLNTLIKYIFTYGFQAHTPVITIQAIFVVLCAVLCSVPSKLSAIFNNVFNGRVHNFIVKSSIMLSLGLFLVILFFDNRVFGIHQVNESYAHNSVIAFFIIPLLSWILSTAVLNAINPLKNDLKLSKIVLINSFILTCTFLIVYFPSLYCQHQSTIWFNYLTKNIHLDLWRCMIIFLVYSCIVNIALNHSFKINKVLAFIFTAILAYTITFFITPGYVYSGYLLRSAPFIVFFVDVILAIFVWFLTESIIFQFKIVKLYHSSGRHVAYMHVDKIILLLASIIVFVGICCQWLHNQYAYYKIFPPYSFNFIKQLRKPELLGKSIITNQYPLPFAYEANSWSYNGSNFGVGSLVLNSNGFSMPHKVEYLWYKNKDSFSGYKQPDYYICFSPHSFENAVDDLKMLTLKSRRCESNRMVNQAMLASEFSDQDLRLRHKLVMIDDSSKDVWAIVKMDWEFPPYFAKLNYINSHFDVKYNKKNRQLSIAYNFKQQNGTSEMSSRFKIVGYDQYKNKIFLEAMANNGKVLIDLPKNVIGKLEIIGIPSTRYKSGPSVNESIEIYQ